MGRISAVKTIRYAYGFMFGHLGAVISRIWLPMLLLTLGGYFVVSPYYESFSRAAAENNPAAIGQAFVYLMLFGFVSLIFYAMIYVAVTRLALGTDHDRGFFHFSLGTAEWRMYGAIVSLALAIILLSALAGMAAGLVVGLLGTLAGLKAGSAGARVLAGAMVLVVYAVIIFFSVRLGFLFAPATVSEERIGVVRSWQLSRGNFWRMLAVWVATLLPVIVLMIACEALIVGPGTLMPKSGGSLADAARRMEQMHAHLPVIYGLSFMFSPFLFGLALSASAFAYRTLVPPQAARSIIADAP